MRVNQLRQELGDYFMHGTVSRHGQTPLSRQNLPLRIVIGQINLPLTDLVLVESDDAFGPYIQLRSTGNEEEGA